MALDKHRQAAVDQHGRRHYAALLAHRGHPRRRAPVDMTQKSVVGLDVKTGKLLWSAFIAALAAERSPPSIATDTFYRLRPLVRRDH